MEVKGILHLTWKKGVPCFIFVVHFETGREIYTATLKIARTLDSTYLFYSYNSHDQIFIGQMKITSTCSYNPDRSRLTETRFVLFGSNESEQHRSKKGLFRSKSRVRNEMKCLTELPENRNLEKKEKREREGERETVLSVVRETVAEGERRKRREIIMGERERPCSPSRERPSLRGREEREERKRGRERERE